MEKLNRKIQPETKIIDNIKFVEPKENKLKNGIPIYYFNSGNEKFLKIEFVFKAGTSYYYDNILLGTITNKLLIEGTKTKTSEEIANSIDFYGAYLETSSNRDFAYVTLYTLNRHLPNTIKILEDIIKNPSFPQHELEILLNNSKQQFTVNNQNVKFVARQTFNEAIFGVKHPYGKKISVEDYEQINTNMVIDFYNNYYSRDNCSIIVSGKFDFETTRIIEKYFNKESWEFNKVKIKSIDFSKYSNKEQKQQQVIVKKNAVQSAIMLGKVLFEEKNSDYFGLQVLNTVLGGYFGSRLMKNIREDKGYTYGIGSIIVSYLNSTCFYVTSEVGVKHTRNTISEIYKELKILRNKLIDEDELNTAKNYMLGTFLRSIDGPYAMADTYRNILEQKLNYDYYYKYLEVIRNISPAELRNLANKYLLAETMYEVVVGNLE